MAAQSSTVTETFERFEFKYWAPLRRVEQALALLDGFMKEDEVAKQAGASQVNTSLYFDSPHFTFLEQPDAFAQAVLAFVADVRH